MTNTLEQLTHDALELSVQERAKLAHLLITSIDESPVRTILKEKVKEEAL
jgi:hypothetical protein